MKTNLPPPNRRSYLLGLLCTLCLSVFTGSASAEPFPGPLSGERSSSARTDLPAESTTSPDPTPGNRPNKDAVKKPEPDPELDPESEQEPEQDPESNTAEPPAEAVTEEAPVVRYPRITSQGQIQFQLDDGALGAPRANSPFPASSGLGPFPADARMFVRRFRPAFDIEFNPTLTLQTEFNIDPHSQRIQVLDVRFDQNLSDDLILSVGRYKVPFGWEGLRSSRATNTIERSDMTIGLYPERDVGISFNHESGLGEFSLGSFLGQPRSNGAANNHVDVIGRGVFNVHDGIRVGLSGHVGAYRPSGTLVDIPVRRLGTELHVEKGPFTVEAEAMWSDGYNVTSRIDTKAFGYYAAVVTKVSEPLDFVIHYDRFDPDLDGIDSRVARQEMNSRDRKVIGLNYYINRKVGHRIMLNYEWKQTLEGPRLNTEGWRFRYQFAW